MALMTPVVGVAADALVARGMRVGTVRKSAQAVAFLGPAACNLTLAALTPADGGAVRHPDTLHVRVQCSAVSRGPMDVPVRCAQCRAARAPNRAAIRDHSQETLTLEPRLAPGSTLSSENY